MSDERTNGELADAIITPHCGEGCDACPVPIRCPLVWNRCDDLIRPIVALDELARLTNEATVLRRALEMACVWTGCAWCPISNECDPVVTPCADAVRDHAMAEARKELGL